LKPTYTRRSHLLPFAFCVALVATAITPSSVLAADPVSGNWTRLKTAHFEFYTTNPKPQALEALQTFEQVRSFFVQTTNSRSLVDAALTIVAFSSEKEYNPYRWNQGACAAYQHSWTRDYIVLQDLSAEHSQVAKHEYTHFVFERLGIKLPIWMSEGVADVYSSLYYDRHKVSIGRPLASRTYSLESGAWLPLDSLIDVGQNSPYYNQSDKMLTFYSESWALTHMLMLSDAYAAGFPKFLSAVASGSPTRAAFESVYGKSVADIERDLRMYTRRKNLPQRFFDLQLDGSDAQRAEVTAVSRGEIEVALGGLLASNPRIQADTQARLNEMSKRSSENPEIEESLGYSALSQNRKQEARAHFALAVERHSNNPDVLYYYACLEQEAGAPSRKLIALLKRVLELNPKHGDARLELGLLAAQSGEFQLAVDTLSTLDPVQPDHAYVFFYTLSFCHIHLNNATEARSYAEKAGHATHGSAEQVQLENLRLYIDEQASQDTNTIAMRSAGGR